MPTLPPGLTEWLPPGAVIGSGMFLFGVVRADIKAMDARHREDMKAMDARHREDMKALNEKLDRLLEARFSSQPVVAPDR